MLNAVRTILFCSLTMLITFTMPVPILIIGFFSKNFTNFAIHIYTIVVINLAKIICGIKWKIEGEENIPNEPFILASKHLSAWETIFFASYFKNASYIFKKELSYIPVFGWSLMMSSSILIKRENIAFKINELKEKAFNAIKKEKRTLVIFPQGTRVPLGSFAEKYPYKKGICAICSKMPDVLVLPATHNSSKFFGRNAFSIKKPGTITVKFMPPIKKSEIKDNLFLEKIKNIIETETGKLF